MKTMIAIALASAGLTAKAAAADLPQRIDSGEGFSIGLPAGWVPVPDQVMREYSRAIRDLAPGMEVPAYDYGYQPSSGERWLSYPYVLVQVRRTGRIPEAELTKYSTLRRAVEKGMTAAGEKTAGLFSSLALGETVYDPRDRIVWMTMEAKVEKGGPFKALVALKLTSEGYIQVMCYSAADEFDRYGPLFAGIAGSVRLVDALRYAPRRPGETSGAPLTDRRRLWAFVAGAAAAALLASLLLGRRRRAGRGRTVKR